MSESPTPPPDTTKPPAADANGQLIVSLAIVGAMTIMGVGLLVAGLISDKWEILGTGVGTLIGALANALTAPSGISNVVRSIRSAGQ